MYVNFLQFLFIDFIEVMMKNILHILLIFCFSLTIFSCAKDKDEDETTTTTTTTTTKSYVSVGDSGTILTSSDGTTWTSRTSGTSKNLNDVTHGNSIFVTVGYGGTILTSSVNGTTWNDRSKTKRLWGVNLRKQYIHGSR